MSREPHVPKESGVRLSVRATNGARVILVEANAAVLHEAGAYLALEGYDVICVRSAAELFDELYLGWEVGASPDGADVVVLGLTTTNMAGLEIVPTLRLAGWQMPVVLSAVEMTPADGLAAARLGVPVLVGPFSTSALGDMLTQTLTKRAQRTA